MRFSGVLPVPLLWFLVGMWDSCGCGFGGCVCLSTCMLKCSLFWCSVLAFRVGTGTFYPSFIIKPCGVPAGIYGMITGKLNMIQKLYACTSGSLFSSGIVLCCYYYTVPQQFGSSREELWFHASTDLAVI